MSKKDYSRVLKHFKEIDPKIYQVMRDVDFDKWFDDRKMRKTEDLFVRLCRTIIGQQLSGKAASTIYGRFLELFGKKKITPRNVLAIPDRELRGVGMSWGKAGFIKDLALKVKDKELHLDKLFEMSDEEVKKELMSVKGIGEWTAEMFLMFTLGRENIFSFGDLGLKKGMVKVYNLKEMPTEEKSEKITAKWNPYKTYGSIALWQAVDQEEQI